MKILVFLAYLWIMVYTVSYMVYEYKCKNPVAAVFVALLTLVGTSVMTVYMFLY